MLTEDEKQACRHATFTQGRRAIGYGTLEEGLCPIGAVAVLRGATPLFRLVNGKHWCTFFEPDGVSKDGAQRWRVGKSAEVAFAATGDVIAWAGYADFDAFLDALDAHGTAIFSADEVPA